ncbi:MAG TPA: tetratricopeptide repeat protein [Myxococcales bacterium]|nr:tetratricopeptide repeat protein [Myxococcales bacterium]
MWPALLALTLAQPRVSPAAEREAKELARRSQLEFDLDHAAAALRDIERAYLLDPLPGFLFNLGQCHRKLGHWEQAETSYRNYLHYRPEAPNREIVLQLIEEVHRRRVQASAPAVVVVPVPAPRVTPPRPVAPIVWDQAPPKPHRSHALAWTLVGVGLAAAIVSAVGAAQVQQYQSTVNGVEDGTLTPEPSRSSVLSQQSAATTWRAVGFVTLGAAVACVPAVIFAW